MSSKSSCVVRLEFASTFEMLDLVQLISDHIGRTTGLDDDALHWVSVAIRECVVNAIKHGNLNDSSKRVFVELETTEEDDDSRALVIRVRDQGAGFDLEEVADPLSEENLLRSSGRGIFLIRSFMDDFQLRRVPEGGMEILMVKRAQSADAPDGQAKA